ncbi:peptide ABC transporter permease [Candidatus Epulonipiscium fishelsonii]|uniref:Peptide ABC transporter permease n=1 Tax=Candidatus Epulonipiscium fishelsonii TaxID=77094 RepID=A0ACC8XE87_9FIRM|nr:peptide ABC transporter permease [Epulopiscium sp. SCG-B05WGA-EpuloA1]ONI41216.1 peptide ABC transporter permease [Epulopiscium sp. SCG-B11WGA-EpuloA1]
MTKYIIKRLIAMMITLFIIISLSFFAIRLIPGDIAGEGSSPIIREALIQRYHLDKSLGEQYAIFIKNFLSFDFGESITLYPRRPVFAIIIDKIPLTLQLNLFSLALTIPVGLACGIIAALRKNTIVDHAISTMVVFNVSVPSFIFASILQYIFAYKLGWFPFLLELDSNFSLSKFVSMILPILALSFGGIATITRYMRAELFEALNSEYMLLSKSKGLSQTQSTLRHAIRNSFIPLCNIIIPMFMGLLGGSMVVENIFGIPGIGSLAAGSIQTSDYYLTIAVLFFYSLIGLISMLLVDISYGIVDPRIRMGGKSNE